MYEVRYVSRSCQVGLLVAGMLFVNLERVEVDCVVWYRSQMHCMWIRNVGDRWIQEGMLGWIT